MHIRERIHIFWQENSTWDSLFNNVNGYKSFKKIQSTLNKGTGLLQRNSSRTFRLLMNESEQIFVRIFHSLSIVSPYERSSLTDILSAAKFNMIEEKKRNFFLKKLPVLGQILTFELLILHLLRFTKSNITLREQSYLLQEVFICVSLFVSWVTDLRICLSFF